MASYIQKRKCKKCDFETTSKKCTRCNSETTPFGNWTVRFRLSNIDGTTTQKRLKDYPENSKNYFKTKKEAEQGYNNYLTNSNINNENTNIDFNTLCDSFFAFYKFEAKESTYVTKLHHVENHLKPFFKNILIYDITALNIANWKIAMNSYVDKNGKKYSREYKAGIFATLRVLLNYAVKFFNVKENVASKVGDFKKENDITKKQEMNFWELEEFKQFISIANLNDEQDFLFYVFFNVLYFSGARKSEITALSWNDIDFQKNQIIINKTATRKTLDRTYKITTPKTQNSIRKTDMPIAIMNILSQLKEKHSTDIAFSTNDFVFGKKRVLAEQTIANRMERWSFLAGIKKIRIHDLRHSHVSFLLHIKGYDISMLYVIANRIGDTTEQVLKTYGHMFQSKNSEIISAINAGAERIINFCA